MRKNIIFLFLSSLIAASCNRNLTIDDCIKDGYKRYDVIKVDNDPLIGFGAQMDTDIFFQEGNHFNDDDLAIWESRIKEMGLRYTRIKYFPEYLERENDNDDSNYFDFNSQGVALECEEMQALYSVLDICERNDIKVDLSISGCWNHVKTQDGKCNSSWLAYNSEMLKNNWVTAPKDLSEYAENVVALLDLLINQKKYTCIWGISNISESFFNESKVKEWDYFVNSCKIIDERLKKANLRDKVKFIGVSEVNDNPKFYKEEFESVKDVFDVCGVANYMWDNTVINESMETYFEAMIDIKNYYGKENFAITEFCEGKHFLDAVNKTDIDDYTAGLYLARFCIEASKAGVTCFNHYILGDTWFGNFMHTMGLWMHKDSEGIENYVSWPAHPEFYFYRMFSKYTNTGSIAYDVNEKLDNEYAEIDNDITIVCFKNSDGSSSYYLANSGNITKNIALVDEYNNNEQVDIYKVSEEDIPSDRNCDEFKPYLNDSFNNHVLNLNVPANSLVVIVSK